MNTSMTTHSSLYRFLFQFLNSTFKTVLSCILNTYNYSCFTIIFLYFCSLIRKNWRASLRSYVESKTRIGDWPVQKCQPMRRPYTHLIPHHPSLGPVRQVKPMPTPEWRQVAWVKTAQTKCSIMTIQEIRKRSISALGWFISRKRFLIVRSN